MTYLQMQKQVEETGIFQLLSTGLLLQFYTYNKNYNIARKFA